MVLPERLEKMNESEFRAEMANWIKTHYTFTLGKNVNLLKKENGFDLLQAELNKKTEKTDKIRKAA